jgi:hypothetical protein
VRRRLRAPVSDARMASPSAIPSMLGIAPDQRRLGAVVRRITVRQRGSVVATGWESDRFSMRARWSNGIAAPTATERRRAR